LNKYIKCNFRGWRCGTTPIWVVRRQRVNDAFFCFARQGTSPQITKIAVGHRFWVPACMHPKAHAFPMNYISAPTGLSRTFSRNVTNTHYLKGAGGGAVVWGHCATSRKVAGSIPDGGNWDSSLT